MRAKEIFANFFYGSEPKFFLQSVVAPRLELFSSATADYFMQFTALKNKQH